MSGVTNFKIGGRKMAQDGSSNGAQEAGRPAGSAATAWKRDAEQHPPKSVSIVETLLQDPVLAAGENIEIYRALVAEVSQEVQPQTLFDRLLVSDLCHAWWEEQRFRRQQAALPVATGFKALQCLLAPNGLEKNAMAIAHDYFGPTREGRDKAQVMLDRFGITEEAIAAQASEHSLLTVSALDRLMANRQSRRDTIVKQYERRKRQAAKPARKDSPDQTPPKNAH